MRIAAVVLVFAASCSLALGATNGAMMMGSGTVQVNGAPASSSYTVFPGDRIETASNGSALVKSPNAVLSISSDSAIQYQGNSLTFVRGNVLITAPKGTEARFGKLVISADPGHNAKFQLTSAKGVDQISAIEGSLNITDGVHTAKLDAGYMMMYNPAAARDDNPTGRAGIPGWLILLLIAGAVAGIVIGDVLAAGSHNGTTTSPHVP
jgi:hypothetical protein